MARLVISLVTYNSEHYLDACLGSIHDQTFQDFELLCHDNRSHDQSAARVSLSMPSARVTINMTNEGFSRAHNRAIDTSQSDYICILNPDLILEKEYFERCIAFLDAHPSVAAVSGLLIRVPSLTEQGNRDIIDSSGLILSRWGHAFNRAAGKLASSCKVITEVMGVSATAALYRRSALEDSALDFDRRREYFDEDFFMYKEDVDLALRLSLRGWKSYTIPQVRAYHIRSTDPHVLKRHSLFINRMSYRNHWFLLIKNIPFRFLLRNGLLMAGYECIKIFYLLLTERSTLSVLSEVLKNWRKMMMKRKAIMRRATSSLHLFR